jgi:hypothetical protein
MTASSLRWPLFALIGLLVAVAVALLATSLVSERIGISSEPITAGESLVPRRAHHKERANQRPATTAPDRTTPSGSDDYVGSASGDPGSSDASSDSKRSEGGDSKQGSLQPSGTPPAATAPAPSAPSAPSSGATDNTTEIEPGDD